MIEFFLGLVVGIGLVALLRSNDPNNCDECYYKKHYYDEWFEKDSLKGGI